MNYFIIFKTNFQFFLSIRVLICYSMEWKLRLCNGMAKSDITKIAENKC